MRASVCHAGRRLARQAFLLLCAALLTVMLPARAQGEAAGLTFHAAFDGGVAARVGAARTPELFRTVGAGKNEKIEALPFEAGVRGQAVRVGDAWLEYPAEGNLNARAGTVSLWVKPVNWAGKNDDFHTLFEAGAGDEHLILYKYFKGGGENLGNRFCFYVRSKAPVESPHAGTRMLTSDAMAGWQAGEWHHVAATWAPGDLRFYADGVLLDRDQGPTPAGLGKTFRVAPPWGESKERDTLVDEFRLYGRPLKPAEVAAEFAAGYRDLCAGKPLRPEATRVQFLRLPAEGNLLAYADFSRVPALAPEKTAGAFEILRDGKVLVRRPFRALDAAARVVVRLPVKTLAPGRYRLRVAAADAQGTSAGRAETDYEQLPPPEWAGRRLGVTDRVLPPYRPITGEGANVRLTLADYDFANTLLLRQVTAHPDPNAKLHPAVKRFHRDSRLLAGPVRLVAQVNGKPVRLSDASMRVVERRPHRVVLEGKGSLGGAAVTSRVSVEYDGVALVRLSIAGKPAGIRDLALEIPLASDLVRLMNTNAQDGNKMTSTAGRVGEWSGPWKPLVWLGDEYRGFCYFADTSRGWAGDLDAPGRMRVVRQGDTALFRMNLVPGALDLSRPWQTEFALCATPSRPMPHGWRGLVRDGVYRDPKPRPEMDPVGAPVRFRVWWAGGGDITGRYDYPVPRYDEATLRPVWTGSKTVSDIVHHYPNSTWEEGPESAPNIGDWSSLSTEHLVATLGGRPLTGGRVDWDTGVKDFWLHHIDRMMQWGLDGMYIDDPYILPSHNDRAGKAFVDEAGRLRPSYGMLGLRDYFRRLRALAHGRSDHPWIDIHMSAQLMLPFYLYCDSFVNGEHLNLRLKEHYVGELRVEEILAQYTGYPWGLAPYLLPELGEGFRQAPAPTQELFGLLAAHDVWFWRGWCSKKEIDRPLKALQGDFGVGAPDCTFLPYWEAGGIVGPQPSSEALAKLPNPEAIVCSAWVRPKQAMLLIANWGEAEAEKEWSVDWKALGLTAPVQCTDALSGTEVPLSGAGLRVKVKGRNYSLVRATGS